jgi:hypothetical protein
MWFLLITLTFLSGHPARASHHEVRLGFPTLHTCDAADDRFDGDAALAAYNRLHRRRPAASLSTSCERERTGDDHGCGFAPPCSDRTFRP